MQERTRKPEAGNKFYITKSKGGYSTCVEGSPVDPDCNVLANCVGYACGRFNEIIGSMKYAALNCNAENFIERAKSIGLEVTDHPTLGGIMCWQKGATLSGSDGAGHVAVVERIIDANTIVTSESGYNNDRIWWYQTRTDDNGRWGQEAEYSFRGCIINPAIGDVRAEKTNEELAQEVIAGKWGNGSDRKNRLTQAGYDYAAVQAIVNQLVAAKKSNEEIAQEVIAGKWGNGSERKTRLTQAGYDYAAVQAIVNKLVSAELKIGDKVKMSSDATVYLTSKKFASFVYKATLYVRSIDGNRIVVSTKTSGAVTGAVDKKYLTKI